LEASFRRSKSQTLAKVLRIGDTSHKLVHFV
jgi:hypothetical protein